MGVRSCLVIALTSGVVGLSLSAARANSGSNDDYASRRMLEAQIENALQRRQEILARILATRSDSRLRTGVESPETPIANGLLEFHRAGPVPTFPETPDDAFDQGIAAGPWPWSDQSVLVEWKLDLDRDGRPEEIRYFTPYSGTLLRRHLDRNHDGRIDSWITYRDEEMAHRDVDENHDGRWDQREYYADDVLTRRDVDRDLDGSVDARLLYRDGWVVEEQFDPDNDGVIDVRVLYDRGEIRERHHDIDGDGEVDVVSFYQDGRLRRRELASPDIEDLPIEAPSAP